MSDSTHTHQGTIFGRIVGLLGLAFGGALIYMAAGMPQRTTGGLIMLFSAAIAIPEQVQQAGQIVIGILRSAGIVKRVPIVEGAKPRLGDTVSASLDDTAQIEQLRKIADSKRKSGST